MALVSGFAALRAPAASPGRAAAAARDARVRHVVCDHHAFVYRLLRRLGVPERDAEDAQQQVFCVWMSHMDRVEEDKDRAFLFGVALRVAHAVRRSAARLLPAADAAFAKVADPRLGPDEKLDERRARERLDVLLEQMPIELRLVLVLHDLEDWTMRDIAAVLSVPPGTVASRLRRAREWLERLAKEGSGATRGGAR